MQSRWNDISARDAIETYAEKGVSEDLALRVYTTRLLGRDPLLVLHGGGNTSVKTRAKDDLGQEHEVIAVKGSGSVEDGEDGVVAYRSAHLDGVESELVVQSGHSLQDQPETIEEVRRILLLHARDLP
jgi:rhamnose utilization protein RhaD (predicted bifunctional aldolase and dehydrogenase)